MRDCGDRKGVRRQRGASMTLRAFCKELGKDFVSGSLPDNPCKHEWMCPNCDLSLSYVISHLRMGFPVIEHFRHETECRYLATERESPEHLAMKLNLLRRFKAANKPRMTETEHKIENKITDIGVVTNGQKIAVECQVSGISLDEFEIRTLDYNRNGYSVFWILYCDPLRFDDDEVRTKAIERKIHRFYFSRVFYYWPDVGCYVIRFKPAERWVDGWPDKSDGYSKTLKTLKEPSYRDVTSYRLLPFENEPRINFYNQHWPVKLASIYHHSFKEKES